ncbi:hypothetical protein KAR91_21130 [Candidatus Pacearchaeota archaeon]|nr:hypothetical protein [Candidatus Pacearchaeota archaeon]
MNNTFNYWKWFFKGTEDKAGWLRFIDRWLFLHIAVGILLSVLIPVDLQTAGNAVLLPLVGILVGLSFAWAGNAQALMQSTEFNELADFHKGGFVEYVFVYQTAILAILVTLVLWGLAGLSLFDLRWPTLKNNICYFIVKAFLYGLSSLTLRECWHAVMGAQWMLLAQREIKKNRDNRWPNQEQSDDNPS